MIYQAVQKKSIKVNRLHFFDDGNLKSLPFLDEIMNAPHSNEFNNPTYQSMRMQLAT